MPIVKSNDWEGLVVAIDGVPITFKQINERNLIHSKIYNARRYNQLDDITHLKHRISNILLVQDEHKAWRCTIVYYQGDGPTSRTRAYTTEQSFATPEKALYHSYLNLTFL